jgi:hypothetical protein
VHRKKIRIVAILLTLLIQVTFLLAIFFENFQHPITPFVIVVLTILLLLSYLKAPIHHRTNLHEHILIVLWIPLGAITCYLLNNHYYLGPVIAATIVGTLASCLPYLNKKSTYLKQLPPTLYCGAFIGMSSTQIASSVYFILAASFFAGVLLLVSKSLFNGLGGKLGTVAFIAVALTSFIFFMLFKK